MDEILRRLQLTELEILKTIDGFCRRHAIRYSLYVGTLLGAVRHKGFIPWDDDLDVCMPREDYERFLDLWQECGPEGYILQNKENTSEFDQSFTKIRKDHTTFLTKSEQGKSYHTGIFVDVFPMDRMPEGRLPRPIFTYRCLKYQLFTREFVPPKGSAAEKAVSAILLKLHPPKKRAKIRAKLLKKITRYGADPRLNRVGIEIASTIRQPLPAELFEDLSELPFEDGTFYCFASWDRYLSLRYGDYMTPPPEKERTWKHQPILVDFGKNLNEIQADGGAK